MIARSVAHKAVSFSRLSGFERAWFVPVWLLLGFSRMLIRLVSFKRLAPWLGVPRGNDVCVPLLDAAQEKRALQIGRVVRLAARYTPWQSNCFPQAVAARLLLGLYRIPYALYFGLSSARSGQKAEAHAWVSAGRVRVTGGDGFGRFAVVGCFVSATALPAPGSA